MKKKNLFKMVCLVLVLSLFAFMAIGSSDYDSDKPTKLSKSAAVSDNADNKSKIDEDDNGDNDDNDDNNNGVYEVGDTLDDDGLTIKYDKAEEYTSKNDYTKPKKGKKLIRLYFIIENNSGRDEYISSADFNCFADGEACDEKYIIDDKDLKTTTLSDGRKTKGYVYYEIPKKAKKVEVEYETNMLTDEKVVFIYNNK